MQRIGKFAVLAVVSLLASGCHRKAPPPPPPAPRSIPPAPSTTKTRRPRTTPQPTAPAASPTPAPPAPSGQPAQPQPEYRLGQALTPAEIRSNNAEIDRRLQHARHVLATVGDRALSNEQQSTLAQIREFIAQAQDMRRTDVVGARSLAERADVLATDLQSSVR